MKDVRYSVTFYGRRPVTTIGNVAYLDLWGPPESKPKRKPRRRRVKATIEALRAADGACIMRCNVCDGDYATNPSDYFWANPGHVFKCCGRACALIMRR